MKIISSILFFLSLVFAGDNPFSYEKAIKNIKESMVLIEPHYFLDKNKIYTNGVVVEDGYIITANSILEDSYKATIKTSNRDEVFVASVISRDKKNDIAILKINGEIFLKNANFKEFSKIKSGDIVFSVGILADKSPRVAHGIISHKKEPFIYTDIPFDSENFLSALVDTNGDLVGFNTTKEHKKTVAASSSLLQNKIKKSINEYRLIDAYFGMTIDNLEEKYFGLYGQDSGTLVVFVDENKSAFASGLKKGDLIVAVNNNPIKDKEDFISFMSQKEHKEILKLKIIRDSFTKEIEIIPAKFNKNLLNNNYFSYAGMVVENISDKKRENLKLPNYVSGVFISEIKDDSTAKKAGLQKNDVIVQIDDKEILNIEDFSKTINDQINQRIHIFRNGWGFIKLLQKEEKKSVFK